MKYRLHASQKIEFEIPDEWLSESGILDFRSSDALYVPARVEHNMFIVAIKDFEPTLRNGGIIKERMLDVLKAIKSKTPLPPVWVEYSKNWDYKYIIHDGYHRLFGSIVSGFTHVPACQVYWKHY